MKVAIISDIHDNLVNLEKCLTWCNKNKIDKIVCPGDITNNETLNYLSSNFSGEIFLVSGNAEIYKKEDLNGLKNINFGGEINIFKIDNLNIGLCHQPEKIKRIIAESLNKLDFIFYGHTHKPWIEKQESTMIVNPGTLSGTFYEAAFAFFDTASRKLELKILCDL